MANTNEYNRSEIYKFTFILYTLTLILEISVLLRTFLFMRTGII